MTRSLQGWLLIIASVPFLKAQAPPILRAEAREVVIDAAVTGRKGAAVTGGLTAKDFSVWEDGKPQKINSVDSADPEASPKHFVIYLDFTSLQVDDQVASKKFAEGFVDGLASPDRYMAVANMTVSGPRVLQNFTTAKAALKAALDIPVNGRILPQIGTSAPVVLLQSLATVCSSMAQASGRKALLLFAGGYSAGSDAFRPAVAACNRANVAVYVIMGVAGSGMNSQYGHQPISGTVRGVNMQSLDPQPGVAFAQSLADGTGGETLTLGETLPDQLAAVAREQDTYYRVAYTPPPAKEGSCHSIKIAVNTRGLETRARNEYCTEKAVDVVAGKIAGQALENRAAAVGAGTLAVSAQVPYFYTGTNRASVRLAADVTPAGMKFTKDKTGLHGQLDIVATVLRPDGGTAARFADTVDIDEESQQSADAFTRAAYHYEHPFTVAAGMYVFQLAIGAGPNAVGKVEMPLKVEPWNAANFGIGAIAFSTEARPEDAESAGGPVLEGRGPLVAGGRQFPQAAASRFARAGTVYFYTEVYDAAQGGANPAALTMQYRILDARTGEVKVQSGTAGIGGYARPGNPVVPVATRLPVAQLPPGSYRLEVRAARAGSQETVARTADFELN